jgi:hypothetical protein
MADWVYAIGEENYDQPFSVNDLRLKEKFDGTGVTSATINIVSSDLTPEVTGASMTVDSTNPLRLLYTITTAGMPQTKGSYYVIIFVYSGVKLRKTFEFDLEVRRG